MADNELSGQDMSAGDKSVGELPTFTVNEEYKFMLEQSTSKLKNDFVSGAREMADSALGDLLLLFHAAAKTARDRDELWRVVVYAAKELNDARPSMNAAIGACLLRALDEIGKAWKEEEIRTTKELAVVAEKVIQDVLGRRKEAKLRLGEIFLEWINGFRNKTTSNTAQTTHLTILTLSNSSTIRACLLTALSSLPRTQFTLHILESRPRFEGADMASYIFSSTPTSSNPWLRIRIFPDCAVTAAVKDANIVLLGADRISPTGDVSNKIGSLSAAICSKALNPSSKIVVLSDADKITAPSTEDSKLEIHPESEMMESWGEETRREMERRIEKGGVGVFGEWFEWVPARFVDAYITEIGVLDTEGVEKVAGRIRELRKKVFGVGGDEVIGNS